MLSASSQPEMPRFLIINAIYTAIVFLIILVAQQRFCLLAKCSQNCSHQSDSFCLSPEYDALGSKEALLLSDTFSDSLSECSQRFCHYSDQTPRSHNHNSPLNGPHFTCSFLVSHNTAQKSMSRCMTTSN